MSVWLVLLLSYLPYQYTHYIDILPSTESSLVTHSTQLKLTTQTYL